MEVSTQGRSKLTTATKKEPEKKIEIPITTRLDSAGNSVPMGRDWELSIVSVDEFERWSHRHDGVATFERKVGDRDIRQYQADGIVIAQVITHNHREYRNPRFLFLIRKEEEQC